MISFTIEIFKVIGIICGIIICIFATIALATALMSITAEEISSLKDIFENSKRDVNHGD